MTIQELQQTRMFDENEYVCILRGEVTNPHVVYSGRLYHIPEHLLSKEIEIRGVGAMSNRRRESLYLVSHEWLQIWIED